MKVFDNNLDLHNSEFNRVSTEIADKINDVVNDVYDEIIKSVLPDSIENTVIKIKDNIGIDKIAKRVEQATRKILYGDEIEKINFGEEASNLITAIEYSIKLSTEKIDKISNELDKKLNNVVNNYVKSFEKNEEYINKWQEYYNLKDFENMEKIYKKIQKNIKEIQPLEEEIKKFKQLENLHTLIKSKGGDFNLTNEEIEISKKLI